MVGHNDHDVSFLLDERKKTSISFSQRVPNSFAIPSIGLTDGLDTSNVMYLDEADGTEVSWVVFYRPQSQYYMRVLCCLYDT